MERSWKVKDEVYYRRLIRRVTPENSKVLLYFISTHIWWPTIANSLMKVKETE